ncbi:MAG: Holliday junction branch migration protein RuvA [Clostridiales bacterium]|jgi:Holliday junction DNA helicase RuvA|nr:Holliday junction branch migration protein RuvA [Clostridiales bacterium]
MIRFLKGIIHPQQDGTVIIETAAGIGFRVFLPGNSPLYKCKDGDAAQVYTSMAVRENDISLYGFQDPRELELFQLLTTVKGVGSKAALSIMGTAPLHELKRAIASEDASLVQQAQGVGKRTSDRVILELKDKVDYVPEEDESESAEVKHADGSARKIAEEALEALGYSHAEAEEAVSLVDADDLDSEGYIKAALKNLF